MKDIAINSKIENYVVHIGKGILDDMSRFVVPNKQYVLISDSGIPSIYRDKIMSQLKRVYSLVFPQGEQHKSLSEYERIVELLVENNIDKNAVIIALGGGVTGDLAGFVASTYLRGIPYIQIPTTLLAQIDSSVGGKVAVNVGKTKNVIGSIYPPKIVLIDPNTLITLPARHMANGMAEMIKYGMIADERLFSDIRDNQVYDGIEPFISRCVEIKKRFVEADEMDADVRQALNFGHTIGHAIEAYYNFDKYLHGEAVAIGMTRILKNTAIKNELTTVLKKYGLPTEDPVDIERLLTIIEKDKKTRDGVLHYVDIPNIGTFEIKRFDHWLSNEEGD
ncbi:MAG: 3-dehydroquinate synthase [Bacilli bacterium]|nr:3-dehydroquinate synthase [Bacilli bacterium]